MDEYVCAFRGRRDSYQVPLALAEGGMLKLFITDVYATPSLTALSRLAPESWRMKLAARSVSGIPSERVRSLWGTTLIERALLGLGQPAMKTYLKMDRRYSTYAGDQAERSRANLFLYSSYAYEAFSRRYPHHARRVMFQYHPHSLLEERILKADAERYPDLESRGPETSQLPEGLRRRERDACRHADLILCASTFTKRSLLEVGVDEALCRVIPYGVDLPLQESLSKPSKSFQAVFVGAGGQRKGLHHLLLAWRRAKLPRESRLVLVCRRIDRAIERQLEATPGVHVVVNASGSMLQDIYATSSLFVMPSLLEGFGQVYLEALAHGCPVLGTANTCLPDLGDEADGIFLVEPANVEMLANRLEHLAGLVTGNGALRSAARGCAGRFSWARFRHEIRVAL